MCSCTGRSNLQTRSYFVNSFKLYASVRTTLNYICVSSNFKLLMDNSLQLETHHINFWPMKLLPWFCKYIRSQKLYQIWGKFALWVSSSLTHSIDCGFSSGNLLYRHEGQWIPKYFWPENYPQKLSQIKHQAGLQPPFHDIQIHLGSTVWKPLVCIRKAFPSFKSG